jgi:filamentous hemagglutinin family protein
MPRLCSAFSQGVNFREHLFRLSHCKSKSLVLALVGLAIAPFPALAQITLDGSTGPARTLTGPAYQIRQSDGTTVGPNLFHSFGRFNLNLGESATFESAAIQNIFARVTGGSISTIDGLLRSPGAANLFLINPAGIVFGQNSQLDVRGSFVATTANAIQFGDRGFFSATNPTPPSPLLTINPSAFFFNQMNQGQILVRSQAPAGLNPYGNPTTGLQVPDGQSLLLVGGDVTLEGGRLRAYSGRVELAGLAAPGRIDLVNGSSANESSLRLQVPPDAIRANILLNNAFISGFGAPGGEMGLYGRTVNLSGSYLFGGLSPGTGAAQGGDITLDATDSINLGPGNSIGANAEPGVLGNAGNVIMRSGDRIIFDGQPAANGDGGTIQARLLSGSVGRAGTIQITTGSLELLNGAQLSTSSSGQGAPGSILIDVRDHVVLAGSDRNGNSSGIYSGITGGISRDTPGTIQIATGSLSLADGAQITTGNDGGQGQGGAIQIQARGTVEILGRGSLISSQMQSGGVGNGGAIAIQAGELSLLNGGQIVASIRGREQFGQVSRGNGGAISLNIQGALTLDQFGSQIVSGTGFEAVGNAGAISIQADSLTMKNSTAIVSDSFGQGSAGNITIQVQNGMNLDGSQIGSGLFLAPNTGSFDPGVGRGGDLRIQARNLSLANKANLSA